MGNLSQMSLTLAMLATVNMQRDNLVNDIRLARNKIQDTLYSTSRFRKKTEWDASGMPEKAPDIKEFLPKDGLHPVHFKQCHGKNLMKPLCQAIHKLVHGSFSKLDDAIYSPSKHLRTPLWEEAFSHQEKFGEE